MAHYPIQKAFSQLLWPAVWWPGSGEAAGGRGKDKEVKMDFIFLKKNISETPDLYPPKGTQTHIQIFLVSHYHILS